jgi:hypothetical protein
LIAPVQLGEIGDKVTISCAFKIAGAEKLLTLKAILRNVHVEETEEHGKQSFHHGLEFDLKNQQETFALHGFVYEQIVKAQSE